MWRPCLAWKAARRCLMLPSPRLHSRGAWGGGEDSSWDPSESPGHSGYIGDGRLMQRAGEPFVVRSLGRRRPLWCLQTLGMARLCQVLSPANWGLYQMGGPGPGSFHVFLAANG